MRQVNRFLVRKTSCLGSCGNERLPAPDHRQPGYNLFCRHVQRGTRYRGNKAWYNISIFPANEPGSFWGHTNDTWQNKWARSEAGEVLVGKERFWLSSTALVWITDLWHASKSLMILAFQIALLLYRRPAKRIFYLTDLVLVKLAFSGGWHVSAWILM